MASALGTPVISIFGRADSDLSPLRWGPQGKKDRFLHKPIGCIRCLAHNCQKEFACLFVVPRAWRGDWAVVDCKAISAAKVFGAGEMEGTRVVVAALCLEGDAEAKSAALQLAQLQEADARTGFFPLYDVLVKYDRLLQESIPELAREYAPGSQPRWRLLPGAELAQAEWLALRTKWLIPHQVALTRLLQGEEAR